jgi:hypothetical protein
MSHQFKRCRVCGSAHGKSPCPIREYNDELEARNRERITAEMIFPGQPALVAMLKEVQARWATSASLRL